MTTRSPSTGKQSLMLAASNHGAQASNDLLVPPKRNRGEVMLAPSSKGEACSPRAEPNDFDLATATLKLNNTQLGGVQHEVV